VQTIPSEDEQTELHSKISIVQRMKASEVETKPYSTKILLDRPINSLRDSSAMINDNAGPNSVVIHKASAFASSLVETKAFSCSLKCEQTTVIKDFLPWSNVLVVRAEGLKFDSTVG